MTKYTHQALTASVCTPSAPVPTSPAAAQRTPTRTSPCQICLSDSCQMTSILILLRWVSCENGDLDVYVFTVFVIICIIIHMLYVVILFLCFTCIFKSKVHFFCLLTLVGRAAASLRRTSCLTMQPQGRLLQSKVLCLFILLSFLSSLKFLFRKFLRQILSILFCLFVVL